ncbi:MAG: PDZ domain-containing protein [Myxococcales bacterium]|nr:PDZ domain-containing protein [Myxococcales bacterium]
MPPTRIAVLVAVACVAAFAFGRSLSQRVEPSDPVVAAAPGRAGEAPDVAALAAALVEERTAREALALEVASLSLQLEALRGEPVADADPVAAAPPSDEPLAARERAEAAGEIWFDESRLVAGGLRPADAELLRELYEEIQLERLYARDAATREGWPGQRLRQEFRELDARIAAVREDWGEDTYDWFLYAADRTNRVEIESVLGSSPAAEAGVRPGDVILSYAGRRIYTPAELRRATTEGTLGEIVALEVVSDGRSRRVDVPRGPLGVRLDAHSAPPG